MSVNIVTIGASGYATTYVRPLLENIGSELYNYVGIVDICVEKSPCYNDFKKYNIPTFKTLEEFYESGASADLVIVVSPPHFHKQQSILAIEHGADVLCEKPIAPLYRDAVAMKDASDKSGKFIMIGYQWSYSEAMMNLKKDILDGKLGNPVEARAFISWPRNQDYYAGWKGKLKGPDGEWILDSIVGNAAAHHLHNIYYLLGDKPDVCEFPDSIRCEIYRANNIETFDTCFMDVKTKKGVKILYLASHATDIEELPKLYMEFEKAKVYMNYNKNDHHVYAEFDDGTVVDYGNPDDNYFRRLWEAIDAVKSRKTLPCVVKTAMAQTFTVNQLWEKGTVEVFPEELIKFDEESRICSVTGLHSLMTKAFEEGRLLSDMGVSWAKAVSFRCEF